jgi:hypothetical protein
VLDLSGGRSWGPEFPRCPIINGHMSCGSRSPPKRKRSFPILAVMPTLKLAGAPEKQAMIPWRGTGALSRRRSFADRACAHPCSTPYSVERADPDPPPPRRRRRSQARGRLRPPFLLRRLRRSFSFATNNDRCSTVEVIRYAHGSRPMGPRSGVCRVTALTPRVFGPGPSPWASRLPT